MKGSRALFDTNAMIAWSNEERGLLEEMASVDVLFTTIVTKAELIYGAMNSGRSEDNLASMQRLLADFVVLPIDDETATHYGNICLLTRRFGRTIPDNDVWIASIARQHGLPVVTRDRHFEAIEGLVAISW